MKPISIFGFEIRRVVDVAPPGRMTDKDVQAAICLPPEAPVFRAVMEIVTRQVEFSSAVAHDEVNAARNPQKTAYYCGQARMAEHIRDYLSDARAQAFELYDKPAN